MIPGYLHTHGNQTLKHPCNHLFLPYFFFDYTQGISACKVSLKWHTHIHTPSIFARTFISRTDPEPNFNIHLFLIFNLNVLIKAVVYTELHIDTNIPLNAIFNTETLIDAYAARLEAADRA